MTFKTLSRYDNYHYNEAPVPLMTRHNASVTLVPYALDRPVRHLPQAILFVLDELDEVHPTNEEPGRVGLRACLMSIVSIDNERYPLAYILLVTTVSDAHWARKFVVTEALVSPSFRSIR